MVEAFSGTQLPLFPPQAHGSKGSQESELAMVGRGSNTQGRYYERPYVQFGGGEEGQDIAEYAVMLAVILVVVVGTLRLIGSNTNNVFSSVASTLQ